MALKNFTVGEMLSLTGPWVQAGHPERELLESVPGAAAVLRFIVQLHGELIGSQNPQDAVRRTEITGALGQLDERHDRLAKAVFGVLAAHREYHHGTPMAGLLEALDQALFPDGLQIVRASYRDSAGRAQVRAALLTGEQRALLQSISVQGGTLLDWVNEWNQQAERIGALMNQRDTPARDAAEVRISREARNRWIRTVRTMLEVLALEVQERPELQRILDRIAYTEAEVERRRTSRGETPADGEAQPGSDLEQPGDAKR